MLVALAINFSAQHAAAGEAVFQSGDVLEITSETPIPGDAYFAGNKVTISADIPGDLFVAGETVEVTGNVGGCVYAAGQSVTISGSVGGTVRAAGNLVSLTTTSIGRDLFAAANEVTISPETIIAGSANVGGAKVVLGGVYEGSTRVAAVNVRLTGNFKKTVFVEVGKADNVGPSGMTVEASAVLEDKFQVRGREPYVEEGATLASPVEYIRVEQAIEQPSVIPPIVRTLLVHWLEFSGVGLLFALLFPTKSRVYLRNFGARPLRVMLMGPLFHILLLLASIAVAFGIATVVLGLGLVQLPEPIPVVLGIGFVSLVLMLGGGSILAIFVAPTLFAGWLTRTLLRFLPGFKDDAIFLPMISGGLFVAAISIIPFAGPYLLLVFVVFATGVYLCGTLPPPAYTPTPEQKKGYERIR